jgi:ornithine cyclodeaminase/alanine dehydrogenase-like protein (mu-crystallin family)
VWSRDAAKASTSARDIAKATGVEAVATSDPAVLVRDSQLVVTTTPTREPILQAAWLHPGLHITAMGSDQEGKNEIEPAALAAADLFVCDRVSQSEKLGELRAARLAGHLANTPPELGEIIAGTKPGRRSERDITICDLTGTGAQDTAIATYAVRAAKAAQAGTVIQA